MSKAYHPDKNKDPGAIEIFRKLTKAHDVLMNEETRLQFNKYINHEIVSDLGLYFPIFGIEISFKFSFRVMILY